MIAAEPGADMRRGLTRTFSTEPAVQVQDFCAESIRLPAGSRGLPVAPGRHRGALEALR